MRTAALLFVLPIGLSACAPKDSAPPAERPSNPTCFAPERPATGGDVATERVFSSLDFALPVALLQAPNDPSRWFVVEKEGQVYAFAAAADPELVLDLSDSVQAGYDETGLLGLAFHPDYAENGEIYVSYVAPPLTSRVSRFTSRDGGATLDPDSEEILIAFEQPFWNHNGGSIAFGPDGYLYLGFGDGGSAGDPYEYGQDTGVFFGKILRIDVDTGDPYGIPSDNPFAEGSDAEGGGAPEIYAWGLRNPWRFSFDRATGALWVGDVGQDLLEEVDVVERGGNYGWNVMEGTDCFEARSCDDGGMIAPIVEYRHSEGQSITGGYVYNGTEIPGLQGVYVYADYISGTMWALYFDPVSGEAAPEIIEETGLYVSSFGEGVDGEIYFLDYLRGGIRKLVPDTAPEPSPFPATLEATGCFDADGLPVDALVPYLVNAPLWSDGATKDRWFALPDGTKVAVKANGDLTFPIGSVLAKQFSIDDDPVETRLFVRHVDGEWGGYSYAWEDGATTLLPGGVTRSFADQDWAYPSRAECLQCHTAAAGRSLGLEMAQLDRDGEYDANQLDVWEGWGLFDDVLPKGIAALPSPDDTARTTEERARATLHANCSNCHQPEGTGQGPADFRFTTALADMSICGVEPQEGTLGVTGAVLLDPGHPETSLVSLRMHARDASRMPELGTLQIDTVGVGLVDAWIRALAGCP